jgi:CubicO group peptidase (beta-lactamase class C family)
MRPFSRATTILRDGIESRAFAAAAVEVGSREAIHWNAAFGRLTYDADAEETTPDTIFDLASLTKVIATTTLAMRAIDEQLLHLEDPVAQWIPEWTGGDRQDVTVADLLSHSSGLTAYLPYFRDYTGRPEIQQAIAASPLEHPARTKAVYSDLGFMLLGFILEDAERRVSHPWPGATDPSNALDVQFRRIASYITPEPLTYRPPRDWRARTAPTEHDPWRGRMLVGEVHDENTWALGGVAAHAGLFGTAGAVGAFARAALHTIGGAHVLARPDTIRTFIERRSGVPGSSRALGWDTMLPTSSCGTLMAPTAIGHTGFTGTSLWIDWERDLYVVLLTNRVHPTRENYEIRQIRPRFHDSVVAEIASSKL